MADSGQNNDCRRCEALTHLIHRLPAKHWRVSGVALHPSQNFLSYTGRDIARQSIMQYSIV
jgi:hypothetical protein